MDQQQKEAPEMAVVDHDPAVLPCMLAQFWYCWLRGADWLEHLRRKDAA